MNHGRRKTDVIDPAPVVPVHAVAPAIVHPHAVLSASLVVSLLLWFPTLQACLDGETTLVVAAIRYLVAFGFVRIALGGIVHLVHQYSVQLEPGPVPFAVTSDDDAPEEDAA